MRFIKPGIIRLIPIRVTLRKLPEEFTRGVKLESYLVSNPIIHEIEYERPDRFKCISFSRFVGDLHHLKVHCIANYRRASAERETEDLYWHEYSCIRFSLENISNVNQPLDHLLWTDTFVKHYGLSRIMTVVFNWKSSLYKVNIFLSIHELFIFRLFLSFRVLISKR